MFILAIITN